MIRVAKRWLAVAPVALSLIFFVSGAFAQTSPDSVTNEYLSELLGAVLSHAESDSEEFSCVISFYRIRPEIVQEVSTLQGTLMSGLPDEETDLLCGTPQILEMLAVASRMSGDSLNLVLGAFETVSATLDQTHTTTHFEIKYTLTGSDATTVAFVLEVANRLEQSYQTEVVDWGYEPGYTFLSSHYKVSIQDIPAPSGSFTGGFMSPGLIGSTITINKDIESRDDGLTLGVCAHEYHHASQHSYLSLIAGNIAGKKWFIEGSAVWMEHEVFEQFFPGNTTDEDFDWFKNRMNRYLTAPYKELGDERSNSGYPSGLYFYFLADNNIVNFSGTGNKRNVVRDIWESLPTHGWLFVNDAIDDGLSEAGNAYNSLEKSFPYFSEANFFKTYWYPSVASQFRSVVRKTVSLTSSTSEIELTAPSPDVFAVDHYGAYYFVLDMDSEEQVNIDFNGNIVDRGILGKIYPNFVLTVYPDGDYSSRELITITNGKGNGTLTCDDAVIVLTRLDDGNILGTPDGGYTITFTRIPEPVVAAMDFEDGVDRAVVRSSIPGLFFTSTGGYDWIYSDISTGQYNYPFYWVNGNFCVWLGDQQGSGRIDFTGSTTKSVSFAYSAYSGINLEAYDAANNLVASDHGPANTGTHHMDYVTVSGENISYVLVHDAGNYWIVDDLVIVDLLRESSAILPEGYATLLELLETVNPGTVQSFLFQVTEMAGQLEVILNWGGSEFNLALYDPDGNLYGEWQSYHPPMLIHIPYAALGEWEIVVTAVDVPSNDYPYALVVGASEPPEDLTPPLITITSPHDNGQYFNTSATRFTYTIDEPESEVVVYSALLDGVVQIDDGQDTIITDLGTHSFTVAATNSVGLSSIETVTFEIKNFMWLRPLASRDSTGEETVELRRNRTLPIKFALFDSTGAFVADTSVRVIVEGSTASFGFGESDTCIRIDTEDPEESKYIVNLHTNFKHWDYGFQIGEPYVIKVFYRDILAHQVRIVLVDPPAAKETHDQMLPTDFALYQNYPNPFNPTTEISFSLPVAGFAKLEVYNIMGQKVATLVDRHLNAGEHTVTFNGRETASGVYFYRLSTSEFTDTQKMVLLK